MWGKPNEFYAILRCTSLKYAKELLENGSIKFNKAENWVKDEKINGKGRGDSLEGVFASCNVLDIKNVINYYNQYSDVYGETINRLTYFRRNRTMKLPCYCFFLLKQELFKQPEKIGKQKIFATIPGSYFKDFANHVSENELLNLKEEDRPALVVISDMEKFINMIIKKLISLGLKESEIIFKNIEYINKKVPFYCTGESAMELTIKDKYFSCQSEGRIIVNTNNEFINEYLLNNPIKIGAINEIATMIDEYFYEGIEVEMTADVYNIIE